MESRHRKQSCGHPVESEETEQKSCEIRVVRQSSSCQCLPADKWEELMPAEGSDE